MNARAAGKGSLLGLAAHMVVLTAIVWLIFGRTLTSYFIADDFGEVAYMANIASGHLELLWANFTGNYMQIASMAVWRPWLCVSLLCDYLIWGAKASGFYLTNVLSFNAVVLALYFFVRQLAMVRFPARANLVAFLSALLFAVSPLHCESVSWVVGRVDIVCALFYLLCLIAVLRADRVESGAAAGNKGQKLYLALSVVFFWLAMWTKEMAIGAPVMAFATLFFFGSKPGNLKRALRYSAPLWLSMVLYFILRYLALGTLLGGYVQGIGDSQAANALLRWVDLDSYRRLILPFAHSLYGQKLWLQQVVSFAYIGLATLGLVRLVRGQLALEWLFFLSLWIATCMAPIYKLWGLGYELEGARFCFFVSMPLVVLLPGLLLLNRQPVGSALALKSGGETGFKALTLLLLTLVVGVFFIAARKTNLDWVHAGKEVKALVERSVALSKEAQATGKQVLVLGIPKRHGGAHMILNGATFAAVLQPPFQSQDYAKPFQTFDPLIFAESNYINPERFKARVKSGARVVAWNSEKRDFDRISYGQEKVTPLPQLLTPLEAKSLGASGTSSMAMPYVEGHVEAASKASKLQLLHNVAGDVIRFSGIGISPLQADYLLYDSNGKLAYHPLSQDWRWFNKPIIEHIDLPLTAGEMLDLSNFRLASSDELVPSLSIVQPCGFDGCHRFAKEPETIDVTVTIPARFLTDKKAHLELQITKPNAFFQQAADVAVEEALIASRKTEIVLGGKVFSLSVKSTELPSGAYCELRPVIRLADGSRFVGNPLPIYVP